MSISSIIFQMCGWWQETFWYENLFAHEGQCNEVGLTLIKFSIPEIPGKLRMSKQCVPGSLFFPSLHVLVFS